MYGEYELQVIFGLSGSLDDETNYYEYILIYADDCLVISQHPKAVLHRLCKYFLLKPKSIGSTKVYLDVKLLSKLDLSNGIIAWTICASKCIKQSLKNPEPILNRHELKLRKNNRSPLPVNCNPEQASTPECDTENAKLYAHH